jgi:hypothetical protein
MRNYVNLAVPTMPLLVADKRGAAETKIIAMGKKRREEPPILRWLEEEFGRVRKKTIPPFPYDPKMNKLDLPYEIESELRHLVLTGHKIEAVKRVTELTGAGLRVSKDYVDSLATRE